MRGLMREMSVFHGTVMTLEQALSETSLEEVAAFAHFRVDCPKPGLWRLEREDHRLGGVFVSRKAAFGFIREDVLASGAEPLPNCNLSFHFSDLMGGKSHAIAKPK